MKISLSPPVRCLLSVICLLVLQNAPPAQTGDFDLTIAAGAAVELRVRHLETEVFDLINRARLEKGRRPLVWNDQAAAVARLHSDNMATKDFFGHQDPDGRTVDGRADSCGLRRWRVIGENIAYNRGFEDPAVRAFEGWMRSKGHRKNILRKKWRETGIGVAVAENGKYYLTQVFIKPR